MLSKAEKLRRKRAHRPASKTPATAAKARRPTARTRDKPEDRDGLIWLIAKGRLSQDRIKAALAYRDAYRAADGPALRSCLDYQVGGGGAPRGFVLDAAAPSTDAKRRLVAMRALAMRGQADMRQVMDAVCGGGLTLRAYAGGDGRKASVAEAVLVLALDMVGAWAMERQRGEPAA